MKRIAILMIVCVLVVFGCGKSTEEKQYGEGDSSTAVEMSAATSMKPEASKKVSESFNPFWIYSDKGSRANHFIPSGFMGDPHALKFNDAWRENCQSGRSCIKITYDVEVSGQGQQWGGIYWQNPANNWGNRKGGFDLTGAKKLTFWARGEKGNERIEEFKIGGLTGDYPDSDTALIGPVILTDQWKEYSIDLRGKDLSYISGGFAWSTNVDVNPGSCAFYLDELRYE